MPDAPPGEFTGKIEAQTTQSTAVGVAEPTSPASAKPLCPTGARDFTGAESGLYSKGGPSVPLPEDYTYDLSTLKGRAKHYLNIHFRRDAKIWALEMIEPILAIRRLCKPKKAYPEDMKNFVLGADVTMYVMHGCGYCERSRSFLKEQGINFDEVEGAHSAETRRTLKDCLNLPLLTFPVIFVKGMYIGGYDQMFDLEAVGQLRGLVDLPHDLSRVKPDPMRLTVGPRGQSKCEFQMHIYSNWLRFYEGLHVILGFVLLSTGRSLFSTILAWLIFVELIIVVFLGPNPFAPMATLMTALCWRVRGNSVTSVPYKLVATFYILMYIGILSTGGGEYNPDYEVPLLQKLGTPYPIYLAKWTMIANSSLLAIFRF
jgi:glutaredoxin 3